VIWFEETQCDLYFSSKLLLFQKFEEGETSRRDDSMATKTAKLSAEVPCSLQVYCALIRTPELGSIQRKGGGSKMSGSVVQVEGILKLRRLSLEV
jgi:hypothetical protein